MLILCINVMKTKTKIKIKIIHCIIKLIVLNLIMFQNK